MSFDMQSTAPAHCYVEIVDVDAVVSLTCHLHADLHQVECHA